MEESQDISRLLNQAADLLQRGKPHEALPHLQQAREIDPANTAAAINLGGAYILLGRHKEAIPLLEYAASLEAQNAMLWTNLGAAYLGNPVLASSEQQGQAIMAFERALELQPGLPNVNYSLGLIYRDQGKWAQAREQFERALWVNPADRDAKMLLDKMAALLAGNET